MNSHFWTVCIAFAILPICQAYLAFTGSRLVLGAKSYDRSSSLQMSETLPKKKVVVTGLGVVSSVGTGAQEFYDNICDGVSGIQRLPSWADEFPTKIGAPVNDFNAGDWMDKRDAKRQARFTHFAMACARQAVEDAKLDTDKLDPFKFGVLIGSGVGGVEIFENNLNKYTAAGGGYAGWKKVSPFLIPALIGDTATGLVAIEYGAKGPNFGVVSACATATHAFGTALHYLQTGVSDIMLAGGVEAALTPFCFAGFDSMNALTRDFNDDPKAGSRPFDAKRSGFVMGEGGAVLCLETEEHAKARGAKIYCELAGYGASCDAHHITAPHPDGEGLATCMDQALSMGGIELTDVDYVNAHGTSTPYNDKFETMALKRVFGEHAYKLKVSSIKSMTGHTLGGAGGLEAVACCKIFTDGKIPPTINYENPDEGLDLDYVPNKAVTPETPIKVAVSDNLGFGGHNAAIAFRRYEE
uniref:Nodulation protein E n=1 Tax=Fibrocapsa japonica TaxID=94617 RepID=A0A6U1MH54_9STRA|mmetsp:Transcript_15969/g.23496  ORF Transcript_15969/g.23496 Transcript_15969/m.23496 type:complete len:469 (+) Transcript_15969:131-1537(+)|eukprot:CAMPEP_0113934370 /NCGR_PEP_ID=MMETSP1339-20121228/1702_1 /TAXON_ID=94617 /ORGANISM="Fibrocapsa japonica" /LENGTH=468 /DNA_ID=CAMNT_0000936149 /DNA_START=86 /DNA_END=1492 /DNA_ORIENTATION=- /assembly_acc=CAM_ASM_000762